MSKANKQAVSTVLAVEGVCSLQTPVNFYHTTYCHIPGDTIYKQCSEKLSNGTYPQDPS
jgi:hypothetical protein